MKRRERRDASETVEGQLLAKVSANVVDDPVDALLVLEATRIHGGPSYWQMGPAQGRPTFL
jgi:hypothetical protein